MRWVKPLDQARLLEIAARYNLLVTVEENAVAGGAGAGVNEFLAAAGLTPAILNLGLPDLYQDHGSQAEQRRDAGLDASSISDAITSRLTRLDLPVGEMQYSVAPMSQ